MFSTCECVLFFVLSLLSVQPIMTDNVSELADIPNLFSRPEDPHPPITQHDMTDNYYTPITEYNSKSLRNGDTNFSDWLADNIWKYLNADLLNNITYNHNDLYLNESNYLDYDYDYNDTVLPSNESIFNYYETWKTLSPYFTRQKSKHPENTNNTKHENISAINPEFTNNQNTAQNLDHLYFYKASNSTIHKRGNISHDEIGPEYIYPPWKNLTTKEQKTLLKIALGESRRHGSGIAIGLTTYYGVLASVGVPGNGLTCLIILTNSYMRTAPNLYLLNIAIVDLISLIMGKNWLKSVG